MLRTQPLLRDDDVFIGDLIPYSPGMLSIGTAELPFGNIFAESIAGVSLSTNLTTKVFADSPYTAVAADSTILANATGGNMVVALPTAVGIAGKIYTIKKTDVSVNTVTVDGSGAQTIDGAATKVLATQYSTVTIQSNGTNWSILSTV